MDGETVNVLDADQPLVLSSYSIGTDVAFEARVAVAAAAGFAGIGLRPEDYWRARDTGLDDLEMKEILDAHLVAVREVEYLTDWADPHDRAGRLKADSIFSIAETFGVTHVNAGLVRPYPDVSLPEMFAALCRRADGPSGRPGVPAVRGRAGSGGGMGRRAPGRPPRGRPSRRPLALAALGLMAASRDLLRTASPSVVERADARRESQP